MFKEHKRYFCTFSIIKYLTKTPKHARDIFQYLILEEATTLISIIQT